METQNKPVVTAPVAPEGFVYNAQGNLIAQCNIPASELRKDAFVVGLAKQVKDHQEQLKTFKAHIVSAFESFRLELHTQYGVKLHKKGTGDNVAMFSFDGQYKIKYSTAKLKTLGPEHDAARQLAREYYESQKDNVPHDMLILVQRFFIGDPTIANTIEFIGESFKDERLIESQRAAKDSLLVIGSKSFFNFYERDEEGKYQHIHLNFAKL
jgi:hypothetical protein